MTKDSTDLSHSFITTRIAYNFALLEITYVTVTWHFTATLVSREILMIPNPLVVGFCSLLVREPGFRSLGRAKSMDQYLTAQPKPKLYHWTLVPD